MPEIILRTISVIAFVLLVIPGVALASSASVPSYFPGYQPLESIVVPVDGTIVTSTHILEKGVTYELGATGTATIGPPGCPGCEFGDAEWGFGGIDSLTINNCSNSPSGVDLGIGVNDPINDNSKEPFWGGPDSASHRYVKDFIGEGASITLNYHDCVYGDNSGSLTVIIFQPIPMPNVTVTTTALSTSTVVSTAHFASLVVSTVVQRFTSAITVTSFVTRTSTISPGPLNSIQSLILGGVSGAGLIGVAFFLYAQGRNIVIRKLEDTIKRNLFDEIENQARPRALNLDDVKQVADKIKDSRELIGDLKKLYMEAKTELDRTKITDEAVRRIKKNVDQVDSFLSLLTSIQTSVIRKESLTDDVLMLASREMKRVQNDLEQINDALATLNQWLETAFVRLAKFGLVADGYKDLALNVGFAVDEMKKPTVIGLTDVIQKISEARDTISEQLRKISRGAYESMAGAKLK